MRFSFGSDGQCVVERDGRETLRFSTVHQSVYNSQYPIPTSEAGSRVYVQNWERGLFCYDLFSGKLLWRHGPGKVRRVLCVRNLLIVEMAHRGLWLRDSETGELINKVTMSAIDCLFLVGQRFVMFGPRRDDYFLYSLSPFQEVKRLQRSLVNPNRSDSLHIERVLLDGDELVLEGTESSASLSLCARRPPQSASNFRRRIQVF